MWFTVSLLSVLAVVKWVRNGASELRASVTAVVKSANEVSIVDFLQWNWGLEIAFCCVV